MRRILKYFFNSLLLFSIILPVNAQDERIRGLRIGYDVSRLAYIFLGEGRSEMEFSLDLEVAKNIYPVLEFGTGRLNISQSGFDYHAGGAYFRLGVDRNYLKKLKTSQYEMLFGGLRYGYSRFTHSAENITIRDEVWGDYYGGEVAPMTVNAHWLEIAGGIRGELFRNFFIGWSFRYCRLLYHSANDAMLPYMIPGFGIYDKQKGHLGFTYSIFYRIPLYKVDYSGKKESGD